jgi:hypothetical protein
MNGSSKCGHYGVLLGHKELWLESKWMQLEDIMLSEVNQAQKDKGICFSHMWMIDPKDKHIHKNKYDNIQTYVCNSGNTL